MSVAPVVGGLFFPQSQSLGIDRSGFSPALQAKVTFAGANQKSYPQAEQALRELAELAVSDKQTRRICKSIGAERVCERDAEVAAYQVLPLVERKAAPAGVTPPALAVVGTDGGRLQIFERSAAAATMTPEVILDDDPLAENSEPIERERQAKKLLRWREDKIALLMTMTGESHAIDPCPEIPASFVNPHWIERLVKELSHHGAAAEATDQPAKPLPESVHEPTKPPEWDPPEVATRHLVATRRPWEAFGPMVAARAWSLGFFRASRRAFLGDGAETNWTLWRHYFSSFVPILDFIHALTYVFHAAFAGRSHVDGWQTYTRWIGWVWAGEVERTIAELAQRQAELGMPAANAKETSPAKLVTRALGYLQNHKDRMRYADYRRQGLPIVSSYVESAVNQFNHRVKGTEKLWREDGAEEILQLRADYLSDGEPMSQFWQRRQATESGQPRHRRAA
jgi:hypothetical protein